MLLHLLLACSLSYVSHITASMMQPPPNVDNPVQSPKAVSILNISRLVVSPPLPSAFNASDLDRQDTSCDEQDFGPPISASKCMDAIQQIGRSALPRQYGQRFLGTYDFVLPRRILDRKSKLL